MPGAPLRSLGGSVALTSVVVASAIVARRDRRALLLVLGAAVLLPWLAVRQSPWLHSPNLAMVVLLFLTAGTLQPGEPMAVTFRTLLRRWTRATMTAVKGPEVVARDMVSAVPNVAAHRERIRRHGIGVTAALGLSLIVVALLASGDALFASYLDVGWLLPDVMLRIGFAMVGVSMLLAGVGVQRTLPVDAVRGRAPRPAAVTLTAAALTVVIGSYSAVQMLAAMQGADYVMNRTGLTYADYARRGFFQTVAVVVITVVTLAVARGATRSTSTAPRSLVRWCVLLTVGTLGLVASSIVKLAIYADRFGLTMLRLYTMIFAVWLGLVAVLTCIALVRSGGRWLATTLMIAAAAGVFGMNGVDPEALVARHNIERARQGGELDVEYLATLSLDARPAILSGLAELGLPTVMSSRRDPIDFCTPIDVPSSGFAVNAEVRAAKHAQDKHC